ncbi:CapA family protein [Metabacillus sp. 84]|uniref:CapA family protein n=1 Tax=Metabacillus sp. 84 TaxID=3404705 RepID=UPI003CEBD3DA
MKKSIITGISLLLILAAVSPIVLRPDQQDPDYSIQDMPLSGYSPIHKPFQSSVTLSAAGDFLIHGPVYKDAETGKDQYDFRPMLEEVRPYFESADLAFINQESILGGSSIGLSSYPSFNTPQEAGDALIEAGIDIVSMANNHTLDRGEKAIYSAIGYYEENNLPYVGAYKNEKDSETHRVLNKNGIRFGFLAYTYGTNGIQIPEGKPFLVNYIEQEKIQKDIREMKALSDCVIVSMHWGAEYHRYPNEEQKLLAAQLAEDGADVIIGHHPHVLQPIEWITNSKGEKTLVIYSLGNFLSGQERDYKDIGGIVQIPFTKNSDGGSAEVSIGEPDFIPTLVTNRNKKDYRVRILKDVDPKLNQSIREHVLSPAEDKK